MPPFNAWMQVNRTNDIVVIQTAHHAVTPGSGIGILVSRFNKWMSQKWPVGWITGQVCTGSFKQQYIFTGHIMHMSDSKFSDKNGLIGLQHGAEYPGCCHLQLADITADKNRDHLTGGKCKQPRTRDLAGDPCINCRPEEFHLIDL